MIRHLIVPSTAVAVLLTTLLAPPPAAPASPGPAAASGTSIERSDDGAVSTVLVHAQGPAGNETGRENRSMNHSDLQPTGRIASRDDVITVTVPTGAPAMQLDIGVDGPHSGLNDGADRGHGRWDLPVGTTEVTSDRDGAVHLVSTARTGSARVRIEGGEPMPTFVLGATSDEDWADEVRRYGKAPLFTVVGQRVFGNFQSRTLSAVPKGITERITELDRVVDITDAVYGLDRDATGYGSHKSPHRIYISSPDSGAGYASATSGRITFQVGTGAAADLFRLARYDLWGYWHEVGHTYQTPSYNWGGLGEVLVNVSPLHIQGQTWGANRLDGQLGQYDAFFKQPVGERQYGGAGTWGKLFMFDQLRRAFGEDFYPRVNQEMRVDKHLGRLVVSDDTSKQQAFARYAARVADRDLRPFFEQWGIALTPATRSELAERPALSSPIWTSRTYAGTGTEHVVAPMVLPTGTIGAVDETVVIGQRTLRTPATVTGLRSEDGADDVRAASQVLAARHRGEAVGTVTVELVNERSTRDVLRTAVDVDPGESFEFRGLSDRDIGVLTPVREDHTLRFFAGTTYAAHSGFGGQEYIGFELVSADGADSIGSWSVRGNQNGHELEAQFSQRYEDGHLLIVRHREARTRLTWFHGGQTSTGRADTTQVYRIVGDRIVREDDPVAGLDGDATTLTRGASVPVDGRFAILRSASGMTADLAFVAPRGTVFTAGQATLTGWCRAPGGDWRQDGQLTARDGTRSPDGTTLEYTVSAGRSDCLAAGAQIEWRPEVTTPVDAPAGSSALRSTLSGQTQDGVFSATS